jgi:DNA-binding NarL/FixJ family response regulator
LSARERDVLGLAAEGHSNAAIAARLVITERTVETHIRSVFQKLDIHESALSHRRVLAVLTYLRSGSVGGR